ncbi:MAG: peptidase MA family metallohydrolase [Anaerolineae bacterium]|jgi:hypothetical protein|nr:peptidase MA family metallohydrolase [Anaerolineae bacterium]
MIKKAILASLIVFGLLIWLAASVSAFSGAEITQAVTYVFGEELTFTLSCPTSEQLEQAWLFIRPDGMGIANFNIELDGSDEYRFEITPTQLLLKPFSTVTYWYELEFENGTEVVTDEVSFDYIDNRVDWQHTANGQFDLYWQTGNHDFGAAALNIAQQAWENLASIYDSLPATPILVYLYPNSADLQEALALGEMNWVAGHADPELNVVLTSVSPGPEQRLEMQRQIPHELAHLFAYASLQDGYAQQPRWLLEGLASMAEATQNEMYTQALAEAVNTNQLMALEDLCTDFPVNGPEVYLAYAQSLSFTSYLQNEYGFVQLRELMDAYSEGLTCNAGFQRTYNMSLTQAQADWQQAVFGTRGITMVWQALSPILLLLVLLGLLPLAITLIRKHKAEKSGHE